jgi:hypothetical protein
MYGLKPVPFKSQTSFIYGLKYVRAEALLIQFRLCTG